MHYNPANDPEVTNGIQEAYGFKIGDVVEYTNPYGLKFGPHVVIGFVQNPNPDCLPENVVYINSDSPWYPVEASSLRKCDDLTKVVRRGPSSAITLIRHDGSQMKLHLIGIDFWSMPVYQDETGQLWKDVNLGNDKPYLHNSVDNDFDGEPDMPMKGEFQIIREVD